MLAVESELVIDGHPQDLCLIMGRFIQILKSHGVSAIKILPGIKRSEIETLVYGLAGQQNYAEALTSSEHLRLGRVELPLNQESAKLEDMPKEEMSRFISIYETVKQQQKLKIDGMLELVSLFIELFREEGRPLMIMAATHDKDENIFTHSTNVCILNLAQAMSLGIEGQLLHDIGVAAMLHDIGKLFIPEEILNKKDKLTSTELEILRQHSVNGARQLLETPGTPRLAIITAYEHHMQFNLGGYPKVADNWQQNLCSHMTMISDFFDGQRTRCDRREPVEPRRIAVMMQNMMGTELHPELTKNFLGIIDRLIETTG